MIRVYFAFFAHNLHRLLEILAIKYVAKTKKDIAENLPRNVTIGIQDFAPKKTMAAGRKYAQKRKEKHYFVYDPLFQ